MYTPSSDFAASVQMGSPSPAEVAGRPLGRHLGTARGAETAAAIARRLAGTAAQIFPGNPKGWRHVPLTSARAETVRAAWRDAGVDHLMIHAPYIINLASPDDTLHTLSATALRNSLDRARELGALYVIVHLGSHKGTGPAAGTARLLGAALAALDAVPGPLLLLENNVGAGNTMGATLEELGRLVRDAAHPRVGVCIDTAHLWGGGHDLSTESGSRAAAERIDRTIGMDHVRVLHLNDSPVPLGSHRDQHIHLGQGQIGYRGLAVFLTQPGIRTLPTVLETPDGGVEQEIIRLKTAALLCTGDADGAAALQEALLPIAAPGALDEESSQDGNPVSDLYPAP